ncbi:hypothetical protein, partial [Thiolapillus sp.]|uniref:hypothetical protein n=2 Tax=Thiolapillus sp. TaxID=2017437 RepID=UPI003AF69B67
SPIPVAVSRCRPRLFLMPVFGAILAQVFGGIPLKTSRNQIIFSPDQARSVFAKGLETDSISNPSPLIKKESSCVVADINIRLLALENVPKLSIGINVGEISNV